MIYYYLLYKSDPLSSLLLLLLLPDELQGVHILVAEMVEEGEKLSLHLRTASQVDLHQVHLVLQEQRQQHLADTSYNQAWY